MAGIADVELALDLFFEVVVLVLGFPEAAAEIQGVEESAVDRGCALGRG